MSWQKHGALLGLAVSVAAGVGWASGCTGSLGDTDGEGTGDDGCADCDDETLAALSIQTTRFPRLSHEQWDNTVRDLFYLDQITGMSASFINDPLGGAFDNNERVLVVGPDQWGDYQTAAEEIALMVTSDPMLLDKIVPTDLPTEPAARARAWIEYFGMRAYRRPLEPAEVDAYVAHFNSAKDLFVVGTDFERGVRLSIAAFLQSPHFLYRMQLSTEVVDHLIPLSGYEVATKLSYMMWNTMPDEDLFAAAADGSLETPEGIMAEAQRMLDDGRAKGMVGSFHRQLFQFEDFHELDKNATTFPTYDSSWGDDFEREAEMFIEDVVFAKQGGLNELLTSPTTYVNSHLAEIYGIDGTFTPDEFVEVQLDPATRPGFLTRAGFLASHATANVQHSIERGVFINKRILCADLPAPPDVIPAPPMGSWDTNREMIEAYTGAGTCGEGCHGLLINPAGFAFENFDALGQYQEMENGQPVNAADVYPFDGTQVAFDGPAEFMSLAAESEMAHACYTQFWLEFAYGRDIQEGDELFVAELAANSPTASVQDLILALTQTKAFRTRAPEEAGTQEGQ